MVISQCLRSACHLRVVGLPDQISPSFVTMPIATFVFDSRSTIEIVWFNVFTHAQLAALVWQTPDEDRPSTEVHDKAMAVPIAIVSFGHKEHKHLMQQFEAAHEGEGVFIDLRDLLSDPLGDDRVKYREDGSYVKTIIAVFGQDGFAHAVTSTINRTLSKAEERRCGIVVTGGCNGGFHRADTWGRAITDNLNSIIGPEGRVANAQQFSLQTAGHREAKHILETAKKWAASPWSYAEPMTPYSYGEVEVKARPAATSTYLQIKSYVAWLNTNETEQAALSDVVKAMAKDRDIEERREKREERREKREEREGETNAK